MLNPNICNVEPTRTLALEDLLLAIKYYRAEYPTYDAFFCFTVGEHQVDYSNAESYNARHILEHKFRIDWIDNRIKEKCVAPNKRKDLLYHGAFLNRELSILGVNNSNSYPACQELRKEFLDWLEAAVNKELA